MLELSRELVLKKLHDCFPDPEAAIAALASLDYYGDDRPLKNMVHLTILRHCQGQLWRLRDLIADAKRDYRNVCVADSPRLAKATRKQLVAQSVKSREEFEAWLRSNEP